MLIELDIPIPSIGQNIIMVPIHHCGGHVVDAGGYGFEERKTGKWVLVHPLQEDDGGAYECSCCKSGSWEIDPATWKVCPWCTALMEVEE